MIEKQDFYDLYHEKNKKYYSVISRNNFTYFLILKFFYSEIYERLMRGNKTLEEVSILDVGCGVGTLALYFGSLGAKVSGIDVSQRAISLCESARKHLDFGNVEFRKEMLKKGREEFDLVIISEVIEHIEDDALFLKNIHSHLKPKGILFLTTPSEENWLYRLGFYKNFDQEVGHLRRYTVSGITQILNANDFSVVALKRTEGPLRNLLYVTKLGFLIRFIRGPLVPLYHFLDELSIRIFGASNIILAAEKK